MRLEMFMNGTGKPLNKDEVTMLYVCALARQKLGPCRFVYAL